MPWPPLSWRTQTLPDIKPPEPVQIEGFAAADSFQGARSGFVFKHDILGLGYYPDQKQQKT